MKIKPGKYVQRDGGIATVAAVDESRLKSAQAIGWMADGDSAGWSINGRFLENEEECALDLIREYREPREFWIWTGVLYAAHPITNGRDSEVIHVREVLP